MKTTIKFGDLNMDLINLLLLIFFQFVLASCEMLGEPSVGPCEHKYLDPIIEIKDVRDKESGQSISSIKIIKAEIDNLEIDIHRLVNDVTFNVVLYDSVLFCATPCGFGTEDGEYSLTISSTGFKNTLVNINAKYKNSKGGCPSFNSGGTMVSFQMTKQ